MLDPAIAAMLRGALALLWLDAARHKLREPQAFAAALAGYRLLPEAATRPVGIAIGAAEAAIGVALLVPAAAPSAAFGAAALLLLYTGAIAINLARGRRDIDCGCGGPALRQALGPGLVLRNLVLTAAAALCAAPVGARRLSWVDAVTVLGGIGVLAAGYAATQRLLANAPAVARLRADA